MSQDATPAPGPPVPRPPVPAPPRHAVPHEDLDLSALLPRAEELEALPVREHVTVFEELQTRLAEQLDDAGR